MKIFTYYIEYEDQSDGKIYETQFEAHSKEEALDLFRDCHPNEKIRGIDE